MSSTFLVTGGDVVINRSSGQPRLIADAQKLRQDLRIALSTAARIDNVGAGLEDVINGRAATPSIIESAIQRRVINSATNMQELQNRYNRNERPRGERLVSVAFVQVSTVANDPTAFYFKASFISGASSSDPIVLGGRLT